MTTQLGAKLDQLGLSQYFETLVSEGFDSWDTVLDIQESDLNQMGVKLGHRRKLQRAIAETRAQKQSEPNPVRYLHQKAPSIEGSLRSDDSGAESRSLKRVENPSRPAGPSTKRRYRRHPKPDENAPERPASAYVIFSNQMREELKGQELSFTEIAKLVGERWQVLQSDIREGFERQAASAKEKYYSELAEYKQTPQYTQYQEYLADFKAKHNPQPEPKQPIKLETETSVSTTSSGGGDLHSRTTSRGFSDAGGSSIKPSPQSPPLPTTMPSTQGFHSKPISPATYTFSNSPRPPERYSPMSASPASVSLSKEGAPELALTAPRPVPEAYERYSDPLLSSSASASASPFRGSPDPMRASSTGAGGAASNMFSRRSRRTSTSLPLLTHEDTTLSSEGGYTQPPTSWSVAHHPGPQLTPLELPKPNPHRILPQPVLTIPVGISPLDSRQVPPTAPPDPRYSSSLAALLRAGELARDADDRGPTIARTTAP